MRAALTIRRIPGTGYIAAVRAEPEEILAKWEPLAHSAHELDVLAAAVDAGGYEFLEDADALTRWPEGQYGADLPAPWGGDIMTAFLSVEHRL